MSSVTLLAEILIATTTFFTPLSHGKPAKTTGRPKAVHVHQIVERPHSTPAKALRHSAKAARRRTKTALKPAAVKAERPHAKGLRQAAKPKKKVVHQPKAPRQPASTKKIAHQAKAPRRPSKAQTAALPAHKRTYTVMATSYQAVASQTDDKPFITADNSLIRPHYGSKKHWMALSRDLLKPWGGPFEYGDKVRVRGISPRFDGVYTVHDTMNSRHRHRMDVLTHTNEKARICQKDVKIQLVERSKLLAAL